MGTWKDPDYHAKWRAANKERWNAYGKRWQDATKQAVFDHYGWSCSCCGETTKEFLCIDHVDGGGNKHRKTFTGPIYRLIKNEGFPEGYQTMCWNCNAAKAYYKVCPHLTINAEA